MAPGACGRERRPARSVPTVLVRLYGSDRVCSLHSALRRLLSAAAPRLETLRREDTAEYRRLLRKTLVITALPKPLWRETSPLPANTSLQRLCTQTEAVRRAADVLQRHGPGGGQAGNVLCAGDGPRAAGGAPPPVLGAPGALLPSGSPSPWTRVNCSAQALQVRVY